MRTKILSRENRPRSSSFDGYPLEKVNQANAIREASEANKSPAGEVQDADKPTQPWTRPRGPRGRFLKTKK